MIIRLGTSAATLALAATLGLGLAGGAIAAPHHHGAAKAGVHFAKAPKKGGYQALVSDGPGTGLGFHRLPEQYSVGALIHRNRQADAVHDAVDTDALTSGGYRSGFPGDDVAGSTPNSAYGVFNGADGYGSPYFAGYYGPGDGEDLGPLGHTYSND